MRPVLKACLAVLPCLLMAEPAAAQSNLLRDALERATGKAVQEGINKALKNPAPKSSTQAKANTQVSPKRRQAMQDQQALNDLGFDAGPVDGIPGRRTANAVRAFQRANGFPETGTLTNAQRERLYRRSGVPTEVLTLIPSIIGTTTDRRRNDAGSNQGAAALTGAAGQSDALTTPKDGSEARDDRVRSRQNSTVARENETTSTGIANDRDDRASRRALQTEERQRAIDAFEARDTARGGTATATKDRATMSSSSAAKEAGAAAAESRSALRCRLRAGDDTACNQ